MRWILIAAVSMAAVGGATSRSARAFALRTLQETRAVIDNARVRVYRTTADEVAGVAHGPAVIVSVDGGVSADLGRAVWVDDAAASSRGAAMRGAIVIVQPRGRIAAPAPPSGSKPGDAPFTGMSFTPMFDNDRVSVIRARMEVGAREGFHTHGSDTIVVHLSGGEIEDTADGKTVVNRWKRGDVEFEGLGSSHSARNVGGAVDVVLVALKP
jgi:quercetin dioxygenase-like cupin family protein